MKSIPVDYELEITHNPKRSTLTMLYKIAEYYPDTLAAQSLIELNDILGKLRIPGAPPGHFLHYDNIDVSDELFAGLSIAVKKISFNKDKHGFVDKFLSNFGD